MPRYFFNILLLVISLSLPIGLSMQANTAVDLASIPHDDTTTETSETSETTVEEREPLTDIAGHWAEEEIDNLYQTYVVNGYGDGTFGPDDPVTRTQFLTIALRAFNYDTAEMEVADFAYSVGIIGDLDLWKNHGGDSVTRAEALKILLNTGNLDAGETLTPNFVDVDIVNDWFAVYSAFGLAQGIVTGNAEGEFNGNETVTRAETCALTLRIMQRQPSDLGE